MRNTWIIMKNYMRRNLFAILLSVTVGVMLCFMIYAMGNYVADANLANIKVGILDYDQSSLSGDFKNYLSEKLEYDIIENSTYDKLSEVLIDKDISAIIEIPQGFGDHISHGVKENVTVTTLDDYENAAFLQANINNYLSGIWILSGSADGDPEVFDQLLSAGQKENINISRTAAVDIDKKAFSQQEGFINSVGFFLMFVFSISIFLSFKVLDDRIYGVFDRIQIAPVQPAQYIVGAGTLGLLTSFLEVGIYCTYIKLTNIDIGVPFWLAVLFMSLFSVFTVCFSLMIALAARSKNTVTSIVIGFSTVGCILGGAYFPITMSPKSLQNLARLLPQFWFMDGLRKLQENVTANVLPNITILVLFTVLTFLIGAVLFTQNTKSN